MLRSWRFGGRLWRSGPSGFTSVLNGPSVPASARPVAGEFTGDLRDDLLVYMPGTGADPFDRGQPGGGWPFPCWRLAARPRAGGVEDLGPFANDATYLRPSVGGRRSA